MSYRVLLFIIIFFSIYNNLYAQPTGERRSVRLHLAFLNNENDTIQFKYKQNTLVSFDGNYEIEVLLKSYKTKIYNDSAYYKVFFKENRTKEDSVLIVNWKIDYIKDEVREFKLYNEKCHKLFSLFYSPSSKKIGDYKIHPQNDIILCLRQKKKMMRVIFKLYSAKGLFEGGSELFMKIPFQEGVFKVIDPEDSQLIVVKDDDL